MRRALLVIAILVVLAGAWREASSQVVSKTWILQNGATAASTGTVAHVYGYTLATVQIVFPTGTSSPHVVVQFQQSMNNIHYVSLPCSPVSGAADHSGVSVTPTSAATADLFWRCNITGAYWFRTEITSFTGGGSVSIFAVIMSGTPAVISRLDI
jgi:hypothetical protein